MPRILVVDDESEICSILEEYFTFRNFEVFTAQDGLAAIGKVKENKPHVVLLDISMPVMSGIDSLCVTGRLVASMGKGQTCEIQAQTLEVYGTADPAEYPLQKKGHSLEFLREIAHLRPRTNTFGAILRVRSVLAYAIHRFFNEKGFFYLNTPLITESDCEGAGAMFQVTTLPLDNPPRTEDGKVDYSKDFFGKAAALTVSGQLEGELGATALGEHA